jgi:heme-degrading monooxygenase HmoA
MIVRIVSIRMKPGHEGLFHSSLRSELEILREQPGLIYDKAARRLLEDGGEEVVLMEEWATSADLHAWAGPDLLRPRLLPDVEQRLADVTEAVSVTHFEAIDLAPD